MNRKTLVNMQDKKAGILEENEEGYIFSYDEEYVTDPDTLPVSLALPKRKDPYVSRTMIPFFDGLIPEGWLLDIALQTWKLNPRDRMGLLLACCRDCIGAVSIIPMEGAERE
jgi:serine/threonine-protein kinase HipA